MTNTSIIEIFKKVENDIIKLSEEMDTKNKIPKELFETLKKEKILAMLIPKNLKGLGLNYFSAVHLMRLIGGISPALGLSLMVNTQVSEILKSNIGKYSDILTKFSDGETIGGLAITEVEAGSDVDKISTIITKRDGKLVLSGEKSFVTNGAYADIFAVLAKKADDKEFILALVEKTDRVIIESVYDLVGMRGAGVAKVLFSNVEIEERFIVAEGKEALKLTLNTINLGRIFTAAISVGVVEHLLKTMLEWTSNREVFGKPLIKNEYIQQRIAELAAKAETAWLATLNAARLLDDEKDPRYITSVAKLEAGRVAMEASIYGMHLLASHGYYRGSSIEKYYRDAKALEIMEGTSEIQRATIFRTLIKRFKKGEDLITF